MIMIDDFVQICGAAAPYTKKNNSANAAILYAFSDGLYLVYQIISLQRISINSI